MATKKMGRPTESLKDYTLRVRMDKQTVEKLDFIADNLNISRSEVVRNGIDLQYNSIKK